MSQMKKAHQDAHSPQNRLSCRLEESNSQNRWVKSVMYAFLKREKYNLLNILSLTQPSRL
jgi:hypothetical protein